MLALVESERSFGAYVCHRRPGGSLATSDLVKPSTQSTSAVHVHAWLYWVVCYTHVPAHLIQVFFVALHNMHCLDMFMPTYHS